MSPPGRYGTIPKVEEDGDANGRQEKPLTETSSNRKVLSVVALFMICCTVAAPKAYTAYQAQYVLVNSEHARCGQSDRRAQ